ncbi:DUF3141 domain-containing protein [Xanthobacter sp. KR7-225]|uniref:DUF3141 domain-containing protein n=1 Tax=Xanthobacter sp. KR7-225 TaxID=3156613 RepID=UPI0032B5CBB4
MNDQTQDQTNVPPATAMGAPRFSGFGFPKAPPGLAGFPAVGPAELANAFGEYMVDAAQRGVLLMDVLRVRGNEQAQMAARPMATVLTFEHQIILSGAGLRRPINYSLARVVPPEGAYIDPAKRPVVVVDPRAGQGPGIGGFHKQSEIGDAFAGGHPVYFIGFSAEPMPGQTFLDVVEGQVRFFEHVAQMHPDAPRAFAIGNCQAGYQTLMVAMLRPDLFGPVLLAGSPISYWQGVHGRNPMRYAGGLFGGSWLTALSSDLGNGKFDGANLISNFDTLNPGNTFFNKLYKLYESIDTESERFLGFEKWWGDFILLNGEEIQYLVDEHFIGNKLTRNETATANGQRFDIRNVASPIIVFTSHGDNISPPQQTLGWILDLYESVDEIRADGRTIVYCLNGEVGHLAIFVSPKVAVAEHQSILQTLDVIDVLPPGLYELVVTPKTPGAPAADLVKGDYLSRFEARTLDDIRALGRNSEDDDRAFATAARLSEINLSLYRTYLQPWVRAATTEQSAEALRALHPARLQYSLFADDKPWMGLVAQAADQVRAARRPAPENNPFLRAQAKLAEAMLKGWDAWRDWRDRMKEQSFFAVYGTPAVQALLGTAAPAPTRAPAPPAKTSAERDAIAARLEAYRARICEGGPDAALVRAFLHVLAAERAFDERAAIAVATVAPELRAISVAQRKALVREQFFALFLAPEKALAMLGRMVPNPADRETLVARILAVMSVTGAPTPLTLHRIQEVADRLEVDLARIRAAGARPPAALMPPSQAPVPEPAPAVAAAS